jgi:uncharacterized membrane protein
MDQFFEFTGRFHPLLVHLPIGFLLIAVIFIWLNESNKVIKISLVLGALAAVGSVITGLILETSGDYSESVNTHKWFGISLAIASIAICFFPAPKLKIGSVLIIALVLATGHFGGTLTHGPLLATTNDVEAPDISKLDMNTAVLYTDAVKPIFEARCYGCHGDAKQKGRLRLDSPEAILKGGKNGKVFEPGNPAESEMIIRIDLPVDDEDHMPPKEKSQLTDQEKKLLSLWVASGGDFTRKVTELIDQKQLGELLLGATGTITLPDVNVPEPDEELITKLTEQGVAITPVAKENNFLQVNFVSVPEGTSTLLPTLKPIAENVLSLTLTGTNIQDLSTLADFRNLSNLNLSGTKITDASLDDVVKCRSLVTLNLSGTSVTPEGVSKLKACEKLKTLNLYNTSVKSADLPGVTIEYGGYQVPTLVTDTTVVKPK